MKQTFSDSQFQHFNVWFLVMFGPSSECQTTLAVFSFAVCGPGTVWWGVCVADCPVA